MDDMPDVTQQNILNLLDVLSFEMCARFTVASVGNNPLAHERRQQSALRITPRCRPIVAHPDDRDAGDGANLG